ncbi:MAG: hypothetical protein RRA35_10480, partial [Desulfomonilia bacterium]|nr:hypothetical protein [Desulfomonilia bacterium]
MDYKETLCLPSTEFPMKAKLVEKEPEMLERWKNSNLYEKIMDREGFTTEEITEEIHKRADVLRWLAYRNETNYQEVANVVNEYYRNSKPIVERAR